MTKIMMSRRILAGLYALLIALHTAQFAVAPGLSTLSGLVLALILVVTAYFVT